MCAHNASKHGIGCQAIRTHSDKHTSAHEDIKISLPNLFEGGSLCPPIKNNEIVVPLETPMYCR